MEHTIKIREAVWQSVEGLTDEQLNKVVEEGTWSIAQVLEHLHLVEEQIVQVVRGGLESEENVVEAKPVHLAAIRGRKVDAPAHLLPSNAYHTLATIKEKLATSREALEQLVNSVSAEVLTQKSLPNPVFGQLLLKDWVAFIGYHEERHLGQIEDIKKRL